VPAGRAGGGAALWPWEQVLGALVDAVGTEVARDVAGRTPGAPDLLAVLVPGVGADTGPARDTDPDRARLRLFEAVSRFLHDVAVDRPVLVVLEDVHDADEESVALLRYLVRVRRAARSSRVSVVATTRDVEGAGPAAEAQAAVGRAGGLVLTLPGLDEDGVGRLVEHHLGSALRAGVAAALRERTDGNPFYLVELTRLLGQERGDHGRADVPVPRSVTAVVESRLRGQSVADREVLGAAALVGRDLDLDLLAEVLGRPVADLGAALDRAAAAGLLVPGRDPGVQRFSHALVREVLEGTVGPVRRATWHAQVAEALIARHGDDATAETHAARIAHHLLHAGAVGDAAATVRFALLAAERAERRVALLDAERLLGAALDVVPRLTPTLGETVELELRTRLGALLSQRLGYDHPDVAEQRRRAIDLARRTGSPGPLLAALWGLWGAALVAGHLAEAEALVGDISLAAEATGAPWVAVAEAQAVGQVRLLQGRFAEAREALERGVALVDDLPPASLEQFVQDPVVSLRGWLTVVLTLSGAPEAEATTRATRRILERIDHAYSTVYVELLFAWCAVWRDDPDEARSAGDAATATARRSGFEQFAAFATLPSAWARGRDDDPGALALALEESAAVCARYVEPGHHMLGTVMSSVHADLLLRSGRAGDALAVLDRAVATAHQSGERMVLADLHRLRAACLGALGRGPAGARAVDQAVAVAKEQGAALLERRASDVQAAAASVVDGPPPGP
jgi:tetratricopeptide (TPR) repeat protein